MKKFVPNISRALLAIAASAAIAVPAIAAPPSTISVTGEFGIGAVFDASEINMAPLPGGVSNLNYAGNPTFFEGKKLCVSGRDGNWSIKRNGLIETSPRQPERRPVCTTIVNGRATLTHSFGRDVDAFIADEGVTRIIAWAADNTLTPGYHSSNGS